MYPGINLQMAHKVKWPRDILIFLNTDAYMKKKILIKHILAGIDDLELLTGYKDELAL